MSAAIRDDWAAGRPADPEDILITCGAEEALHLALGATTEPGDVVAVGSPAYFGVLQVIETLGRKAVEIPTCAVNGMEVAAVEVHSVRACVVTPNFHNPLGALMMDGQKEGLVQLLTARGTPIIEDDTFGELHFDGGRPRSLRAWNGDDRVLRCGSFSKILAPGYRVGWIVPGPRYMARIARLKLASTIATSRPAQLAIARFLSMGGYDAHLRRLRRTLRHDVARLRGEVARRFPEGRVLSQPRDGFVIWVGLPGDADALDLHRQAQETGISISPGPIFSPTEGFRNFIRLSAGHR